MWSLLRAEAAELQQVKKRLDQTSDIGHKSYHMGAQVGGCSGPFGLTERTSARQECVPTTRPSKHGRSVGYVGVYKY